MIYAEWLKTLVKDHVHDIREYSKLLDNLDCITYHWRFVMDENRAKAGENLRSIFAYEIGVYIEDVREGIASVLEVLIGVAKNMSEQTEIETGDMFWLMMRNMGLDKMTDSIFDWRVVSRTVNSWLDGEFEPDGTGSPFPLYGYDGDCTHLDLYSHMNIYVHENFNKEGVY